MTVLRDITFLCTGAFVLKGGPQHWAFLWAGSVQVPRVAEWASPGGEALMFCRGQRPDGESPQPGCGKTVFHETDPLC